MTRAPAIEMAAAPPLASHQRPKRFWRPVEAAQAVGMEVWRLRRQMRRAVRVNSQQPIDHELLFSLNQSGQIERSRLFGSVQVPVPVQAEL